MPEDANWNFLFKINDHDTDVDTLKDAQHIINKQFKLSKKL